MTSIRGTYHRCPVSGFEFIFNKPQLESGCPDCGFGGRTCPLCGTDSLNMDGLIRHVWQKHRKMIG